MYPESGTGSATAVAMKVMSAKEMVLESFILSANGCINRFLSKKSDD